MALYLYEFLYRGRAVDHPEPPAYHVILAEATTDAFDRSHVNVGPAMTPEQAAAKGFDLPDIVKAINAGVMAENTSLKVAHADLTQQHESLQHEHQVLAQTSSAQVAKNTSLIADLADLTQKHELVLQQLAEKSAEAARA